MPEYSFTDEETIARISDTYPRAMSSYFIVLHRISSKQEIVITRQQIIHQHMKSWTKFKNDLRNLAQLYVVDMCDDGDSVSVMLITNQACA